MQDNLRNAPQKLTLTNKGLQVFWTRRRAFCAIVVKIIAIPLIGWDISSLNLAAAMERAKVFDYDLQRQLRPHLLHLRPRPSVYYPDFIAANQADRADNIIHGTKWQHVQQIREDIRDFKNRNQLDKVIVLWTANTERFCDCKHGLNDTAAHLLKAIKNNETEVSASTVFAVASILENVSQHFPVL